ncbi:mandelate racemase/muconate lactonizing enzyme family protein [Tuwongella immobilis]|uniref:Mandelate racemase/muconate lactonizing enzyme C-terminal domain-containing protein n=1 Tax=Tuwongella immobilis TaxID=692036 RepID=A0A6C2YRP4_9BACT|nr:mandelate racemase/muconate lactonizing enzyme family protein [Tuwongella immobilis]VIP03839.1 mandelate racemase muconate lactonizing protein : Mandelate racemase/muconate lactonizing protein OS=Gammaproteobacteria bacterium MFB021 GN=GY26_04945 PE=4 SV=1: MR_MLE_N: MR_MLE: MR_MLE_C [Tuwongella immobilis]VTS05045.1 mandelate racemase muconate lactonizing protein : Mandelate racemase/muconate lactonizing protein OS=Gammaproteobacteria bacterium MFB021 GN=GY26_04945 PE=4 SV=1: MR_MLE_N: MR_MLE:
MSISGVVCRWLKVPASRGKVSLAGGDSAEPAKPVDVILVEIQTTEGVTGLGVTLSHHGGAAALLALLEHDIAPLVRDEDAAAHEKIGAKVKQSLRRLDSDGLISRAYAAIDIALWDLKGKLANLPLWRLLGAARPTASAFLTVRETRQAAKKAAELGAIGVRVELAACDPEADAQTVGEVRASLGDAAWLAAAANERYDLGTALALGQIFDNEYALDWFESPTISSDIRAYRKLSSRLDLAIATGDRFRSPSDARGWLRHPIARVLRPDVLRLGGITPWLRLAAMAEPTPIVLSPYRLPEIGIHLACGIQIVQAVEWVDTLSPLWEVGPEFRNGQLVPPTAPGLGLVLNEKTVKRLAVS